MSRDTRSHATDLVVLALFLIGFGCGLAGFWDLYAKTDGVQRAFDALHSTLQLIILEGDAEKTHGPLLSTARLLLPLSTSLFVLSLLLARGAQWGIRAWLAVRPWVPQLRPLVLVIGCGASGLKLARYYALGRMSVVGIDRDVASANARRFRAGGFQTLEFEFDAPDDVRALPLRSARRVVVCTGDDVRDLEICRNLLRAGVAQQVTVTFETPGVNRAVEFDPLFADRDAPSRVNFLDLNHFNARLLFREKPPHRYRWDDRRFVAGAANPCHVALVMDALQAQAYLPQAVRSLVYSPDHPLRISLFTEDAAACEARLRSRFPALFPPSGTTDDAVYGGQRPLAHVSVFESSPTQLNVVDLRTAHRTQWIDVLYVLGADDAETALLLAETVKGADVLDHPRPTVVAGFSVEVTTAPGVWGPPRPRVPSREADDVAPLSYVFDQLAATGLRVEWHHLDDWVRRSPPAGAHVTPDAFADELALKVHNRYRTRVNAARWEDLPEHERWLNRHTVDHGRIKLALLDATPQGTAGEFEAALTAHLPWLARLEHRRYACERMLDGWIRRVALDAPDQAAQAEGRPKLNRYHLNPTLEPFDALPEDQRIKDREIAQLLHEVHEELRDSGLRSVLSTAPSDAAARAHT
jgi:SAM-dependent methyltransferase